MPKITIITINRNNKTGLRDTIKSVLEQSYPNLEYIIIDGGSTDGSTDEIIPVSDKLAYWVSEPDTGIYNAMNKGIRKASGEYLMFLNSGDCLADKDVIASLFPENLESYDIICGDLAQIFPNGKIKIDKMPDSITAPHLYSSYISHPSAFIKKELFNKHGLYDESFKIAGDHAFFVKVFLTDTTTYLHKDIVVTNYPMNGISSVPESTTQLSIERIRAFKEQIPQEYYRLIVEFDKLHQFSEVIHKFFTKLGINRIITLLRRIKRQFVRNN